MTELERLVKEISRIAKAAGTVLMEYYGKIRDSEIELKGGRIGDLLTVADKASEDLILKELTRSFPGVGILTEEAGEVEVGSERFIIDPLDGTTNFSRALQHFAVSIAFENQDGIAAGVVYLPFFDDCFSASRKGGAHCNGDPISVSHRKTLAESVLATGFACVRTGYTVNNLDNFVALMPRVRGIRRLGSAAVDLCYIASGVFDGYFELGLSPWDIAAGALIVLEAGGIVTDLNGGNNWQSGSSIAASNRLIHRELLDALVVRFPK